MAGPETKRLLPGVSVFDSPIAGSGYRRDGPAIQGTGPVDTSGGEGRQGLIIKIAPSVDRNETWGVGPIWQREAMGGR